MHIQATALFIVHIHLHTCMHRNINLSLTHTCWDQGWSESCRDSGFSQSSHWIFPVSSSLLAVFQQSVAEAFDWPFPHSRAKLQDKGQLEMFITSDRNHSLETGIYMAMLRPGNCSSAGHKLNVNGGLWVWRGPHCTVLALWWTRWCWDCWRISKFFQGVQVGVSQFAQVCFLSLRSCFFSFFASTFFLHND